ncbi:rhamnogalacturonan lyase family protein [Microbacterium sp. zg.Y909]|uniref:rhamnogalacturonan lyase family protein n=1 Tax=Microbacterium sp. zg.Y909 TaxID=2969413 RepID=UPI0027D91B30|nr:fibronectin type III domain-containing protein [Microbacterium sp. zg.Y909]
MTIPALRPVRTSPRWRAAAIATATLTAAALALPMSAASAVPPDAAASVPTSGPGTASPQLESLDRGVVAVDTGSGVFISWRLLQGEAYGADATGLTGTDFAVYRDGEKIATVTDSTNLLDAAGSASTTYQVAPVLAGREGEPSDPVSPLAQGHLDIPLTRPADGVTPAGETYTYAANDVSVGDVDGDGAYEYVVKWDPSNAKDVSQVGYTGPVFLDTYELDGTLLSRIELGDNIRAGAHYTQFLVYDFDGDGRAETMLKTAPGTKSTGFGPDGAATNEAFITMPAEDLAAGFSHDDDYRMSAADYEEHLVQMFLGWSEREEVVSGQWPATLEEAFGTEVAHEYPLSRESAEELVDYFIDVFAPGRSARNVLRAFEGFILEGPEYLTVFDGATGQELQTVRYEPGRGDDGLLWGDYAMSRIEPGNRVDRFLSGVAYLDGERPSAVFARGYYTRSTVATYDWDGESLSQRWFVDSGHVPLTNPFNDGPHGRDGTDSEYGTITTQGFHSLSAADVDGDGRHEIVYGSATLDDDGGLLYSSFDVMPAGSGAPGENTRLGHGDAMHVADIDPARPGLEIFTVHEGGAWAPYGTALRDAATGEVLFGAYSGRDTGRGMIGDVRADVPGMEVWSSMPAGTDASGLLSATGDVLAPTNPGTNQSIRWAGDLTTQVVNGAGEVTPTIDDWTRGTLLTASGTLTNNGTKGNPSLVADVFGDWREELLVRTADSAALRVYTSTEVTGHKLYTLMHDPQYRAEIARQQTTYNQPAYTSFHLASGMDFSAVPLRAAPQPVAAPGLVVDGTDVTVSWEAPAEPGTHEVTGYVVTLTPEQGEPLVQEVAGDVRTVTFAAVAPGRWSATVVARSAAGASEPSDASPTATVTKGQPTRLLADAYAHCVGRSVYVGVFVLNAGPQRADITVAVQGSEKHKADVRRGGIVTELVNTRERSVAAGSATVTASAVVDGVEYRSTYEVGYPAAACRR